MSAKVRSVVVNGCHIWECSRCGRRWNPDAPQAKLTEHERTCRE